MNVKDRIVYFDLLKLFAVLLVIVGHVISQYDSRGYSHPVNVWIYSFHMPLFMFMSGLFFRHTLLKKIKEIIYSKSILLLLPLFTWSIVNLVLNTLLITPIHDWDKAVWHYITSFGPLHGLWYLKCLFIYLITCYLTVKIVKNEFFAAFLTIVLFMLLPDINFSSQMIVFFWIGHFYSKTNNRISYKKDQNMLISLGSGIIMLCIFLFLWHSNYSYLHRTKSFLEYIIFFIMGISSVLFWVQLFKLLFQNKKTKLISALSHIGMCSLGIYCSQEYFYIPHFFGRILDCYGCTMFFILWSIAILTICYILVLILQKNKYTSLFFLGNYNQEKI